MKSQHDTLSLDALAERYEVMGELAGRDDARTFIGRRRDDGVDVLIAVSRTPEGDEGNALSHVASDAQLLAAQPHPNVVPVLDGQWVGTDAFAVVSERSGAPSVKDILARRDEEFSFPRIAAILQSVNHALEWARDRKIVHRGVALDTLFIEPGSDHVRVTFAVQALPRSGMPGAETDARTIAGLARAMLTRSAADPERDNRPLAEVRPGLPAQLIAQTEALLGQSRSGQAPPDVSGYIASLAMADALKGGEIHLEKTRHIIEEQRRVHREQLEKERRQHNEHLAAERAAHQEEVAEQARRFEKERDDFAIALGKERTSLERERQSVAKERAAHARDCATLKREREAHERDVGAMREKLEWESAALKTQSERFAGKGEPETDLVLSDRVRELDRELDRELGHEPEREPDREPDRGRDRPRRAAPVPTPRPVSPEPVLLNPAAPTWMTSKRPSSRKAGPSLWTRASSLVPRWNRSWTVPAVAGGVLLVVAGAAIGLRRDATVATKPPARVVDSVAGAVRVETLRVAPRPDTSAVAGVPADLMTGVAGRADSAPTGEASDTPTYQPTAPTEQPVDAEPTPRREERAYDTPAQRPTRGSGNTMYIPSVGEVRVDSVRRGGVMYRAGEPSGGDSLIPRIPPR